MSRTLFVLSWILFFMIGVSVGRGLNPIVLTKTVVNTELLQPISVEGRFEKGVMSFVFWPTGSRRKYRLVKLDQNTLSLGQEEEIEKVNIDEVILK